MTKTKIHHAYDPPPKVPVKDFGPSLTRQSEKDACDINRIVARFEKTGILPSLGSGFYADVSGMTDYREALDQVRRGQEVFMSLDAATRAMFENDAAQFLDFVIDPANREELEKMGLVTVEQPEQEMVEIDEVSEAAEQS